MMAKGIDSQTKRMNRGRRFTVLCWFVLVSLLVPREVAAEEDLYKILGVSRKATTKEIKSAYRRKALDTHPDKNKDIPKEQAAEAFHKVVEAFETLSDSKLRKQYDRTGRTGQQQQQQQQGFHRRQRSRSFTWSFQPRSRKLKDRFDVKEAMSRVMHIVSLEQLKTVMLDDNDLLERNLLIAFVTAQEVDDHLDDEMVFPFPFAAKSSQGIWWEDLLQTVKVRYHNENDLTRFFNIAHGDEMRQSKTPVFLFGKRGKPLSPDLPRFSTRKRDELESWVWKQLHVLVKIINKHTHPVELYWVHGKSAQKLCILQPGEVRNENTMLSHEFLVRDARVDTRKDSPGRNKLTPPSILKSWKILSDQHMHELVVPPMTCFDLSGHCLFWQAQGECRKNPVFMDEQCRKTCGKCDHSDNEKYQAILAAHEAAKLANEKTSEQSKQQQHVEL